MNRGFIRYADSYMEALRNLIVEKTYVIRGFSLLLRKQHTHSHYSKWQTLPNLLMRCVPLGQAYDLSDRPLTCPKHLTAT